MGFLNRIFLSHTIGAEGLGIYQVVGSVFGVLITLTSSGLPISVSKQTASLRASKNYDGGHATVSASVLIGTVIGLSITLLAVLFKDELGRIFTDERCIPIFMVLLPGIAASAVYSSYRGGLWGQKNFLAYSFVEFIEEFILVATSIILVSRVSGMFDGARNAAISVSIAYVAAALIAVILYFYYDGKVKNPRGYIRPLINSAAPITGIRLASSVVTSVLAVMLPKRLVFSGISSSKAMSLFGIASGMVLPLLFIPGTVVGSLALVLLPELSAKNAKRKNGDIDAESKVRIKNAYIFALFMALFVLIPFMALGNDLGILIYKKKNAFAGVLLTHAAPIMIPLCLSQITSSILNALGKEYKSLKNYLLGIVCMLASVYFLPPIIGIYSMVVGFATSFTLSAVLNSVIIFKDVKPDKAFWGQIAALLSLCASCTLMCYLINTLLKTFMPAGFSVVLSLIPSVTVYLLSLSKLKICNVHIFVEKLMPKRFRSKKLNKHTKIVYNITK